MTLTAEQLAQRQHGIGSSEIAAVVGCNPWQSVHEVYGRKVGILPEPEVTPRMERGNRMEPVLLDWWRETHPDETLLGRPGPALRTLHHREHLWALATPDGIIVPENGTAILGLVEAKAPGWRTRDAWGEAGTDHVPEQYLLQCQWQMEVLDVDVCDLVADVDEEFRIYPIRRDREVGSVLIERARVFWQEHVERRVPPAWDGSAAAAEILRVLYRDGSKELIPADEEIERLAASLRMIDRDYRSLEEQRATLRQELQARAGKAGGFQTTIGPLRIVRTSGRASTDWKTIAEQLAGGEVPMSMVESNTTVGKGSVYLRPYWRDGGDE